uniref:Non-specific serine/threonine protein kinase n=1 Tax=Caenorhabditis tropicalis TaxID=1561998 RepID=A0A1I7TP94_9PELO
MTKSNPVTPSKQEPEDWNELLSEFVKKGGRGLPKTFIKKLWAVEDDLTSNANPSVLRMMYCSPALLTCPEGVKLGAEILVKIGIGNGLTLLEKQIIRNDVTDAECQRYGEVFHMAWQNAFKDSNFDITEELETEAFAVFCQHALFAHKPICTKFQKVIAPFAFAKKKDSANFGLTITRILNGCLYRALDSINPIVKASGAEVFFTFFPFVESDSEEMSEDMERQLRYMLLLLQCEVVSIRTMAVKRALQALTQYWMILPKHKAKEIGCFIYDKLTRDSVVGVRVAVFEGMLKIAYEPLCVSVYEYGMKCASVPGVQDTSERVRLAAYQTLVSLKNHKYLSLFEIHERDDLIAVLEMENVEDCRQQFIPIMHAILPIGEGLDEQYYHPRVDNVLSKSRLALLTYFRLLGPMGIIKPNQTAELITMFITWAYRYLRSKDGLPPVPETEDKYKKARAYLECALILYMSCKKMLTYDCEPKVKGKCDQLFGKVVKEIFDKYVNTPILGTATAISSVIPKEYLKTIGSDVLARLADDEVPAEALEPFLESALHFNPESIFDSINTGLEVLVDMFGDKPKQNKKKKRYAENPEEELTKSLNRLKYIIQSHSTSSLLAKSDDFKRRILESVEKIDLVREAIDIRLAKAVGDEHALRDETLLTALEFRFILPVYAVSENHEDEDERKMIINSAKTLLNWFRVNIADKMIDFADQNFSIKLSVTFLNCLNVLFSAYDYKTRPMENEDEEDEEKQNETVEKEDETTVATMASRVVKSLISSCTPSEIMVPALRIGATLCEDSYNEAHYTMAAILRFIPKWLNKQLIVEDDEEEFSEQSEREFIEGLRQFHKRVCETDSWDEEMSSTTIDHFASFCVMALTPNNDDEEFDDPLREDYNPPRYVSIALLKFILKDKALTGDFINQIMTNHLPEDSKYFKEGEQTTERKLTKLAALAQMFRILEKYSKTHSNLIKEMIQIVTTRVLECFTSAPDLNTVNCQIMNSVSSLLDVNLPDDS